MRNLYFVSKAPLDDVESPSFDTLMRRTGANTGNLFFMRAVERQLRFDRMQRGHLGQPEKIGEQFDAIVIPAANWLSQNNQFLGNLAARIEKTKLPCVVIGLGAQSLNDNDPVQLSEGSKRFLHVVSERSHSIGVRGEFTAEVAASAGIRNITVTGCPSLYWSLQKRLKLREPRNRSFAISVNASRNRRVADDIETAKIRVERQLYLEAFKRDRSFIAVQTEETEGRLALKDASEPPNRRDAARLKAFLGSNLRATDHQHKFRIYSDIDSWIMDLADVDLVMGTRLHGCLLGLAAGVPSILITIDSRTQEIATLFGLPHYPATSDRLYLSPEDLYHSSNFSSLQARYPVLYQNYRRFLTENGLTTTLSPESVREKLVKLF